MWGHIITPEARLKMRASIKKRYDLVGKKFGKLTVVKLVGTDKHDNFIWECKCDCGGLKKTRGSNLKIGDITHCGCLNKNKTHGMYYTRFYGIWSGMLERCRGKTLYKKRGIKFCKRWKKFENFRDDMYESYLSHVKEFGEKQTTLDRIDNDGNYEPENCRWADYKTQIRNSGRYIKNITCPACSHKFKWKSTRKSQYE